MTGFCIATFLFANVMQDNKQGERQKAVCEVWYPLSFFPESENTGENEHFLVRVVRGFLLR